MSSRVEETVKAEKKLNPNVDFFRPPRTTPLVFPIDLFTAYARPESAGRLYSGAVSNNNRLIRPGRNIKGIPIDTCDPLEQR